MSVTMRPRRPWTPEEDDQLRISMANGKSALTIAADLERTTRSVRRRTEILRLSWKAKSALAVGTADRLTPSGVQTDHVGPTNVKITHHLIASPRWTPEEDDRLRRLADEGRSAGVTAERLKRTRAAVYTRAKKLGVTFLPVVKPPRR
jgi:hypothetical protein